MVCGRELMVALGLSQRLLVGRFPEMGLMKMSTRMIADEAIWLIVY